jgi:hypothetical protein
MRGKLNDKYHIIFFSNTVFNAAVLCTTSVTVCFTSPNETIKEIVLLVTAACRSRRECCTNPMIGTGEYWSTWCCLIQHKSYLNCSRIELKYWVLIDSSQILLGLFRDGTEVLDAAWFITNLTWTVQESNWSIQCGLIHHKPYLNCSGIKPGSLRWEAGE